ncbi:unnamed protein product (macronuclear) [Paramecium tetraurelia]|uniref:Uncharacterized protein n=1 Tax=Paramecium tetraurelia TaxID=5888 RepID=A0CMY0_PARTE|nr:uncharacterized protein GSPATT00008588001 [Paramecium tetraurelia]CAK72147.1 unnamed protein product [Paramecium tetraurelia]|eukprot:XP_001439544.1 hypothetical protein (macronuclear) [Paramecium tetraurelia strain d4-2]
MLEVLFRSSATVYDPVEFLDDEASIKPQIHISYHYQRKVDATFAQDILIKLRQAKMIGMEGFPTNLKMNFHIFGQVALGNLEQLYEFGIEQNTHDGTGIRDHIHVQIQERLTQLQYTNPNKTRKNGMAREDCPDSYNFIKSKQ